VGAVYIPEPLTAPELWYPGRVPTMPVKLNLRHPLSKNLEAAIFADPRGAKIMIDYARGITIPVDEVSDGAVIFNGSRSYAIGLQHLNGSAAMSITAKAYTTRALSNDNIISSHDAITSQDTHLGLRFDYAGSTTGGSNVIKASFVSQNDTAIESTTNLYQVGVPITLTSKWQVGDPQIGLFSDGLDVGLNSRFDVAGGNLIAFSASQMRLGIGPQTALQGGIFFVLVHSRKLTDAEILSLHSNPYQILEAA
jgi:hypothetical protein